MLHAITSAARSREPGTLRLTLVAHQPKHLMQQHLFGSSRPLPRNPPCGPHLANRTVPALPGPPWPAPGQPVSPKSARLNLPRMDSETAWIYCVVVDIYCGSAWIYCGSTADLLRFYCGSTADLLRIYC